MVTSLEGYFWSFFRISEFSFVSKILSQKVQLLKLEVVLHIVFHIWKPFCITLYKNKGLKVCFLSDVTEEPLWVSQKDLLSEQFFLVWRTFLCNRQVPWMLNYLHETIDAIPNLVNLMNLKCQYHHILHSCWVKKKSLKQTNNKIKPQFRQHRYI